MMKLFKVFAFSLLLLLPYSSSFAAKPLTEKRALDILVAKIQKDKIYDSWTTLSCLSFLTEEKTREYFYFTVYEKHGGKCLGDPAISSVVDRFKVDRFTKKIKRYDPIKSEFYPFF